MDITALLQVQIRSRVTLNWAQQFDNTIVTKCWNTTANDCAPGCIRGGGSGCVSNSTHFAQYYQAAFDRRSIVGPEVSMDFEPMLDPNGSPRGGKGEALFDR